MKLHQLPKLTTKSKKRLGRGYGSGKGGHTSSRGQKGQKTRTTISAWFEGGQLPMARRLPFLRGKDRFKRLHTKPTIVDISRLDSLPAKSLVNRKTLYEHRLISLSESLGPVKLLGTSTTAKSLVIEDLILSASAAKALTQAGATINSPASQQPAESKANA